MNRDFNKLLENVCIGVSVQVKNNQVQLFPVSSTGKAMMTSNKVILTQHFYCF